MVTASASASDIRDEIARLQVEVDGTLRGMSADERRAFAPLLGAGIAALKAELPPDPIITSGLVSPASEAIDSPRLPHLAPTPQSKGSPASSVIPKPPASGRGILKQGQQSSPRRPGEGGAATGKHRGGGTGIADPSSLTLGQALAAGLYMLMESLQVRVQASRLTVVLKSPSGVLSVAADCGGPQRKMSSETRLPLRADLLRSIIDTGMAASLPTVSLEDIEDRKAVRPRNVLALPIRGHPPKTGFTGVVIAVNSRGGATMFNDEDERVLFNAVPSISYLTQTYDVDYVRYAFDPAPLHRYAPLPVTVSHGENDGMAGFLKSVASAFTASKSEAPPMLVFRREGPEKFIRKETLRDLAAELPAEGDETHLVAVSDYIERVESAWGAAIERCMISERTLRQKQALVAEAVDVLGRKQRKVDLLKEVLADNLKTQDELERDAARAFAQASGAGAGHQRPGISFRNALVGSGATGGA